MNCISFSIFLWMGALQIQNKNLLSIKMVANYLNFIFHIEVKTKSKYKVLNFVFQFIKDTKWHFGYTDFNRLIFAYRYTWVLEENFFCNRRTKRNFVFVLILERNIYYQQKQTIKVKSIMSNKKPAYPWFCISEIK